MAQWGTERRGLNAFNKRTMVRRSWQKLDNSDSDGPEPDWPESSKGSSSVDVSSGDDERSTESTNVSSFVVIGHSSDAALIETRRIVDGGK